MRKDEIISKNGVIIKIDEEDYEKLKHISWYAHENRVRGKVDNKWWGMHNYILNTRRLIDHIDRNALNNRKSNLRIANKSKNAMNSKLKSDNTSGIKGVSWSTEKQKWHVYININGKRKFLGYYTDLKVAAEIRIVEEIKQFKEFANLELIKEICYKYNIDYEDISAR